MSVNHTGRVGGLNQQQKEFHSSMWRLLSEWATLDFQRRSDERVKLTPVPGHRPTRKSVNFTWIYTMKSGDPVPKLRDSHTSTEQSKHSQHWSVKMIVINLSNKEFNTTTGFWKTTVAKCDKLNETKKEKDRRMSQKTQWWACTRDHIKTVVRTCDYHDC